MRVRRIEVRQIDKEGLLLMDVWTTEGKFTLWGRVTRNGKIKDERGRVLFRIPQEMAEAVKDKTVAKLRYIFAVSKEVFDE